MIRKYRLLIFVCAGRVADLDGVLVASWPVEDNRGTVTAGPSGEAAETVAGRGSSLNSVVRAAPWPRITPVKKY